MFEDEHNKSDFSAASRATDVTNANKCFESLRPQATTQQPFPIWIIGRDGEKDAVPAAFSFREIESILAYLIDDDVFPLFMRNKRAPQIAPSSEKETQQNQTNDARVILWDHP